MYRSFLTRMLNLALMHLLANMQKCRIAECAEYAEYACENFYPLKQLSPQICPKTSQHLVRVTFNRQEPFYFNQLPKRFEEFDDDNAGSQMNLCVRANLFRTLLLRIPF